MRAPRVLIVSPTPTHPARQGNAIRILALGRQLKRRGIEVDLLHAKHDLVHPDAPGLMAAEWSDVVHVEPAPTPRPRFAECWGLDDWCDERLADAALEFCERRRPDAVIVNYVWLSRILDALDVPLKVLDTHDIFGGRHEISRRAGIDPNWFFTTEAEEERGFDRADVVLAIQAEEAARIRARTGREVMVLGHPAVPRALPPPDDGTRIAPFGYIGSANPWNVRAATSLDVALAAEPAIRWALAGRVTGALPEPASSAVRIGEVERVEDFYRGIDCAVNPMPGGTGLKIKTLEALAFGRPVIGTATAFEGIPVHHSAQTCADLGALVSACDAFRSDAAFRADLGAASARSFLDYLSETREQFDAFALRLVTAARSR